MVSALVNHKIKPNVKIEDWCYDYSGKNILDFAYDNLDRTAWLAVMGASSITYVASGDETEEIAQNLRLMARANAPIREMQLREEYERAIAKIKEQSAHERWKSRDEKFAIENLPKPAQVQLAEITVVNTNANLPASTFDLVFFDSDDGLLIRNTNDLKLIVARAQNAVKHDGLFYLGCRVAVLSNEWDINNSIGFATDGTYLPSSQLLYNDVLSGFSVRPLVRDRAISLPGAPKKVYRCAPLRPILLMIHAQSQGGKTTLSRALSRQHQNAHVSCDYVYHELLFSKKNAPNTISDRVFFQNIKTSDWEDVGNFFREMDKDHDVLRDFLDFLTPMIPRNYTYSSIEIDLRTREAIDIAKEFFEKVGMSVWEIHR